MKKLFFILIMIAACVANVTAQDTAAMELVMDYPLLSEQMDTIYVDFKLVSDGQKISVGNIDKSQLHLEEVGYSGDEDITLLDVLDIRSYDPDYANENYSIIVIADRAVSAECLKAQRDALTEMFQSFPKADFYITAMDNDSRTPTASIMNTYQLECWIDSCFSKPSSSEKFIYKALASVIEEVAGEGVHDFYPEIKYNQALLNDSKKSIVVLTNGKYMNDKGSYIGGDEFFRIKTALINGLDLDHKVQVNYIYFGDNFSKESFHKEVQYVMKEGDQFYPAFDSHALKEDLVMHPDPNAMDYRMVILNPEHKLYDGQKITLHAYLDIDGSEAYGVKYFTMGSMLHPMPARISNFDRIKIVVECIIAGLICILLIYLLFRIVVPRCKNWYFHKKYVKTFVRTNTLPARASDYVAQKCYFCKDDFVPGDTIVTKCEHTMHYDCWQHNGHKCPEYGRDCNEGYFYYNEDHPWDKRNKPYYLKSLLIGTFVGLIAWILYRIFTNNTLFYSIIGNMVALSGKVGIDASGNAIIDKVHDLLFFGLVIGFCISFGASWVLEKRHKTLNRVLIILLRGVLGALGGFIAGFIGSLVAISTGKDHNCFIVDIIAWLLLGTVIGFVVSYNNRISVARASLGGLLLAMLGFCTLYLFNFDDSDFSIQYLGQLVSFLCMLAVIILSGGLFAIMATPDRISERYFLHIEGTPKTRDVAIYKWMNRVGGYRVVTIGRDDRCYIDMYWDDSDGIDGVKAEVYMENDTPYYKNMATNKSVSLKHGDNFIIGKTVFTYIEKDKI